MALSEEFNSLNPILQNCIDSSDGPALEEATTYFSQLYNDPQTDLPVLDMKKPELVLVKEEMQVKEELYYSESNRIEDLPGIDPDGVLLTEPELIEVKIEPNLVQTGDLEDLPQSYATEDCNNIQSCKIVLGNAQTFGGHSTLDSNRYIGHIQTDFDNGLSNICTLISTNVEKQVTKEKPFKCELCNYSASVKRNLSIHLRTHTGIKPYKCETCNYSSTVKKNLTQHIRTHTGAKPYQCTYCDYTASARSSLVYHIKTHTGEKPYQCEMCEYSSSKRFLLMHHIRTHTGERPHQCKICGYSAAEKSNLTKHIKTHGDEKPHKCGLCDYSSYAKKSLTYHLRLHTGEKPFRCDVCNYSAHVKSSLVRHMRKHTGEKAQKCHLCSFSGYGNGSLIKHLKTHVNQLV